MSENAENPAINDENKIPVNIITGFLGSGKTTLLNHWVNSEDFKHGWTDLNGVYVKSGDDDVYPYSLVLPEPEELYEEENEQTDD